MSRRQFLNIVILVLGTVVAGQIASAGDHPQAEGAPRFVTVELVRLKETMTTQGLVMPGRAEDLVCRVSGEIAIASIVPEGTHVKQGDLVCQLDATALKDQLTNQQIKTISAQSWFTNAQLTREVAEIAVLEYREGILVQERAALEGQRKLYESLIKPHQEELDRMLDAQKRAREAINQGLAKPTPTEILAEISIDDHVRAARHELHKDGYEIKQAEYKIAMLEKYTAPTKIKLLKSDVEKARSDELAKKAAWELEGSKERGLIRQIAACRLVAPIEGVVSYASGPKQTTPRAIEKGAKVRERQTIAWVMDLKNAPLQIHAKVSPSQVDRLRPGQTAWARIRGQGETRYPGKIKMVVLVPDLSARSEERDERVFTVVIELEKNPAEVLPGVESEVSIVLTRDDAMVIPKKAVDIAVFESRGNRVVVKNAVGGLEWRTVSLGVSGGKMVEVKEGLKKGDSVLVNPELELTLAVWPDESELEIEKPPAPAQPAGPSR